MHSNLHIEIQFTVKAKEQIVLKLSSKSDSLTRWIFNEIKPI